MNWILDDRDLVRAIETAEKTVVRGVLSALSEAAEDVAEEARRAHDYKDRTGRLTRSITDVPARRIGRSEFEAQVVARTEYAQAIEEGAAPHAIRPKRAGGFLVFRGRDGRLVRTKAVQHPGNRAYRFLANALERRIGDVQEHVMEGALDALEAAGFETE